MIKFRRTFPFVSSWQNYSLYKDLNAILKSYYRFPYLKVEVLERFDHLLKLRTVSFSGETSHIIQEYWDDAFSYNYKSEEDLPDWLK